MLKQSNKNRGQKIFDFLHRNIIIIIIITVVLAGGISTIAIVRGSGENEEEQKENVTYETMTDIYLAMDRVQTLNPLMSEDRDVFYISQLVYSSLFQLDETLNVEPEIVKTYKTNPSEGSVAITLRDDVKFSDGTKLTASDVSYTVNTILSIGESCPYYSYVNKIQSVQVNSQYDLVVHFEEPADAALDNLVFPIVSSASYRKDEERVPGSGQYAYGSYSKKESLKLKPNQYYYGDKAENRIEFKVVKNKDSVEGLMTMEAVTAYVSRDSNADARAEDKDLLVTSIPSGELEYLAFNFKNRYLKQKEVRQAIAKAIDTESLINDNYGGAAVQSDSLYFPGFLGTENKKDVYDIDQKGAVDLLKKAGYRDSNEDGIMEDNKHKNISMTILVNRDGGRQDTAAAIAESLKEIGIDTKVKALEWSAYRAAIKEGDFDLYLGGYKLDKKNDLRMMFRAGSGIGYDNRKVKALVGKLETCLSAEDQRAVYEELKLLLNDDLPYYGLCYKNYSFITVNPFHGEGVPTFFDIFRGCSSWTWEKTMTKEPDKDAEKSVEKSEGK